LILLFPNDINLFHDFSSSLSLTLFVVPIQRYICFSQTSVMWYPDVAIFPHFLEFAYICIYTHTYVYIYICIYVCVYVSIFCLECNIFNRIYLLHNFFSFLRTHYRGKRIRCCNVIIIITSVVAVIVTFVLGTPVVDNVVKYIIVLFINASDFDVADINSHTPSTFNNLTSI